MSELITTNIDKDGDLWIKNVTEGGEDIVFTKDCMTPETAYSIINWLTRTFEKRYLKCPECKTGILLHNLNRETFACSKCGLVIDANKMPKEE